MKLTLLLACLAPLQLRPTNSAQTVRVVSPLPVTIHTGIAGWVGVGLTALLVSVGIAGVIVAVKSLRRIERQTKAGAAPRW